MTFNIILKKKKAVSALSGNSLLFVCIFYSVPLLDGNWNL